MSRMSATCGRRRWNCLACAGTPPRRSICRDLGKEVLWCGRYGAGRRGFLYPRSILRVKEWQMGNGMLATQFPNRAYPAPLHRELPNVVLMGVRALGYRTSFRANQPFE